MLKHNLRRKQLPRFIAAFLLAGALAALPSPAGAGQTGETASAEIRLKKAVEYLASDELEGRGVGSKGIDLAADYIAAQFTEIGLRTDLFEGKPFQTFTVSAGLEMWAPRVDWKAILGKKDQQAADSATPQGESATQPTVQRPPEPPTRSVAAKNVVAILEGQGPQSSEAIIVGAHYDHLGVRRSKDGRTTIHNGANDNASGVATMIEVARILSVRPERLPRRIIFAAFSGEERGLIGSFYYVKHPSVSLQATIAMINLDMIGRPNNHVLGAAGMRTSPVLTDFVNRVVDKSGLTLMELPSRLTGSDHLPFYGSRVPAVHFMTIGGFGDYHAPSDDSDKLDYAWMRRLAEKVADLTVCLAEAPERPKFVEAQLSDTLLRGAVQLWGEVTTPPSPPPTKPPGK